MHAAAVRALKGLLALMLVGMLMVAHAGSIEPRKGVLSVSEDGGTVLNAEFTIDLGPRLEEAVARGVPLYFTLELEVTRPRWWWSNENVLTRTTQYRLSYTALTRQYRLTTGNLHRNFTTLDEALRVMSRFVDLSVADRGVFKPGEGYDIGMRLSLDRNQLPKPLQVDAIANRDWQVDSRVLRWHYVAGQPLAPTPAAAGEVRS